MPPSIPGSLLCLPCCFNCLLSERDLGSAALPSCISVLSYIYASSDRGNLACMHSCTLLVLHSIQAGQLCMWVPRSWASSTLSSRSAVPSVHTAIFALFSGQGSPVGGNCSVVLVLHSLSSGAACVQSSGCLKQHPAVLTESVSGWRGSLYAFYSTLLFLLSLVPGGVGWGHATVLCR